MTDQEQTNAMADILGKLDNAAQGKSPTGGPVHEDPTSKAAQTDAMADVLKKLQDAAVGAAHEIVTESKDDPNLGMAWQTSRTETGVTVSRYDIRSEKKTISEGLSKTLYSVIDNSSGEVIYKDLGLFESAMGIVKHMLFTQNESRIQGIASLDRKYLDAVTETFTYKHRLRRLDESSVKYDVTCAKYSSAKNRMQSAKTKILKAL